MYIYVLPTQSFWIFIVSSIFLFKPWKSLLRWIVWSSFSRGRNWGLGQYSNCSKDTKLVTAIAGTSTWTHQTLKPTLSSTIFESGLTPHVLQRGLSWGTWPALGHSGVLLREAPFYSLHDSIVLYSSVACPRVQDVPPQLSLQGGLRGWVNGEDFLLVA